MSRASSRLTANLVTREATQPLQVARAARRSIRRGRASHWTGFMILISLGGFLVDFARMSLTLDGQFFNDLHGCYAKNHPNKNTFTML